jgi:hypothetical protein
MNSPKSFCQHCWHEYKFHRSADGRQEVRCDAEVEGNLCGCISFLPHKRESEQLRKMADVGPSGWYLLTRGR